MATTTTVTPVKSQLVDKLPKRFKGIKFGIQSVHHPGCIPCDAPTLTVLARPQVQPRYCEPSRPRSLRSPPVRHRKEQGALPAWSPRPSPRKQFPAPSQGTPLIRFLTGYFEQNRQMLNMPGVSPKLHRPFRPCQASPACLPYRLPAVRHDDIAGYLQGGKLFL